MSNNGGDGGFWQGLVIGTVLGAVLALLFAPRSGEDMREQLMERSLELRGLADEMAARGRSFVDEQRAVMKEAFEEGRQAAMEAAGDIERRVEEARGQA